MNRKNQKEIQVTTHMVRQFLQENEDTGYRDFHSNLLPAFSPAQCDSVRKTFLCYRYITE